MRVNCVHLFLRWCILASPINYLEEPEMDDLQQIQKQIDELQTKAHTLIQSKKAEVIEHIKGQIKAFGITGKDLGFQELALAPLKGVPRYRQGVLVWTGKGRKPQWIVDFLAQGGSLDELKIQK